MTSWYLALPVLVTGGAGFIGSHLVENLVELGAQVTVMDNLSTGSLHNLQKVRDNITFIHADINNYAACIEATRNKKVIFHLAAFVSVPESLENPELCYKTNVLGTLNLLQAAQSNGVERFIFSSSSAVYGSTDEICSETTACKPESPYGHSKLLGETLCAYFTQQFGLTARILRYFNVHGPRQNPNGAYAAVVAKFKAAMAQNLPLTIFGDGLQTRDFIPVTKVVDANIRLAYLAANSSSEVFNIGTGTSISLLELIETLKQEYPSFNNAVSFMPSREGDIKNSHADCAKYLGELNLLNYP